LAFRATPAEDMRMKTFIADLLILASAIAALAATCASQPQERSINETAEVGKEIRNLNAREVDAFIHNDPKTMAQLWSDDFVVTNPLNKFVTKQQVLQMVESGLLAIPSYERQIEYLRVYGSVAIVAGSEIVRWGGRMPNVGKTEQLRFTAVWMSRAGK
jgi:Domain of unknown function (DUF4440)